MACGGEGSSKWRQHMTLLRPSGKARSWKIANCARPRWACRGPTMPESGAVSSPQPCSLALIGLSGGPAPSRLQRTEPLTFISGRDGRKEPSPANVRASLTGTGAPSRAIFSRLMRILIASLGCRPCQSVHRHRFSGFGRCEWQLEHARQPATGQPPNTSISRAARFAGRCSSSDGPATGDLAIGGNLEPGHRSTRVRVQAMPARPDLFRRRVFFPAHWARRVSSRRSRLACFALPCPASPSCKRKRPLRPDPIRHLTVSMPNASPPNFPHPALREAV